MKTQFRLLWFTLVFAPLAAFGGFPSIPAFHLVNDSGVDIQTALGTNTVFVSDFKGKNDVTVTLLAGSIDSDYLDVFGGADSFDNPGYVTNFVGAVTNGTGNGSPGYIEDIQTENGMTLQFDFALRLMPQDRFLFIDCDNGEQYQVQAFVKNGASYNAESLGGWSVINYAGSTEELPNSSFPNWNPTSQLLTSSGSSLSEPLTVFIPDQPVDRIIVSQIGAGGTASLQFVTPTPPNLIITLIRPDSVTISWPNTGGYTLQQNSVLNLGGWTTSSYPITTANNTNSITINPATGNQFFRLSLP